MRLSVHGSNWENLNWSEWIPLYGDASDYQKIPTTGGVYRVRAVGTESLIYIGQTGRNLRERLRALRKGVMADEMPFNDPHTAAPNLWVWRKEKDYVYECSAVAIELTTQHRQALEDMLLWRHRVETKQSTLCNYGKFHPNWSKSLSRKKGIRGVRLKEGETNLNGGYSSLPLNPHSHETALDWMELQWSEPMPLTLASMQEVPFAGGVYRIIDLEKNSIIYIGESKTLQSRLSTHCKAPWSTPSPYFSFAQPKGMDASHRRHEIEVDLIGAFYFKNQSSPKEQYR